MLPETLLCLLNVALALSQTTQELPLNTVSSFTPSNTPNPPVFSLPRSSRLAITIAQCSTGNSPRFFVTNSSDAGTPGSGGGSDVFEIALKDGYGNWTGAFRDGGILAVESVGQTSFELGISENGLLHEILPDLPLLGDTTSNQALLFSSPFWRPTESIPTYPNYTLPPANLSLPVPPAGTPDFRLVLSPTSSSSPLTSLPQTGCMLSSQKLTGTIANQTLWLGDQQGWRTQWLVESLTPATNYTAYVLKDRTKVSGPIYFVTKSATFTCPLVFNLPYCPNVAYTVPLPPPPRAFGSNVYTAANLPAAITTPLLSYLTNFTVSLTTFACGRDWYSPIVGCNDCQREYRNWLCTITFTRCGEPSPANPDSFTSSPPFPGATGLSALQPKDKNDPSAPQKVFSALVPQPTNAVPRSPNLPAMGSAYMMLLPCLEMCTAVDRACPSLVGFSCPTAQFNAAASYGVGYKDSADGDENQGATGGSQDRWGNIWCNGS